jgi:hypothetical protein
MIEHAAGYWMKSDRRAVALSAEKKKKADEVLTGMGCMK